MHESNASSKPVAVRINDDCHLQLGLLGRATGKMIPAVIRDAVDAYALHRMLSPTIDEEIREAKRNFSESLRVLRGAPVSPEPPASAVHAGKNQITLRLSPIGLQRLTALALIDRNSLADQIRSAIEQYLEREENKEAMTFASSFYETKTCGTATDSVDPKAAAAALAAFARSTGTDVDMFEDDAPYWAGNSNPSAISTG